jgi:hypothetical protein
MFFADRAGLSRTELTSLTHGSPEDPCWATARERVLIRVVDALHDSSDIDDMLWRDAHGVLGEPELLDLFLLCGWYHAISFVARATRVAPEPEAPRFADIATR